MEVVDCQSFLLLKKQITDTEFVLFVQWCIRLWDCLFCSELITKCQFLQSQLEMVQKERAKQQVELKVMENVRIHTTSIYILCDLHSYHTKVY